MRKENAYKKFWGHVRCWRWARHYCSPRKLVAWRLLQKVRFRRVSPGSCRRGGSDPGRFWPRRHSLGTALAASGLEPRYSLPQGACCKITQTFKCPLTLHAISTALNLHPICPCISHLWISASIFSISSSPKASLTSLGATAFSTKTQRSIWIDPLHSAKHPTLAIAVCPKKDV